jgi:hypothetical protein
MKNHLFSLAAVVCLGFTAPTFAANGSVAAAMVKDAHKAAARRIEAQAGKPACVNLKPGPGGECKPGTRGKEKSKANWSAPGLVRVA